MLITLKPLYRSLENTNYQWIDSIAFDFPESLGSNDLAEFMLPKHDIKNAKTFHTFYENHVKNRILPALCEIIPVNDKIYGSAKRRE